MLRPLILLLTATACAATAPVPGPGPGAPPTPAVAQRYRAYVVSESADEIALVAFDSAGARVVETIHTGMMPTEINGPHGVAVSPDGEHYYVSVAHGAPFGTLWKYRARDNEVVGRVVLGLFPATVQLTPDGEYAYVVNFNLHGDMVPSSVSVVATGQMLEIARIQTCTMPHGSRINPQGTKQYSACMMDDMLVEIDTRTFGVSRHFRLTKGEERGMDGPPHAMHGRHAHETPSADTGSTVRRPPHQTSATEAAVQPRPGHQPPTCSPTWAQPSADGSRIYVACNKSDEIIEIDHDRWEITRRFLAGAGVYNLAVSPDGRLLVATNKRGQSVSIFEIASGKELARIPTGRKVVHGAVVTADSRYAFITVEGIGSEPGTVEIIDLANFRTVGRVDVGQQAAGIDLVPGP